MAPPPALSNLVKVPISLSDMAAAANIISPGTTFGSRIAVQTPPSDGSRAGSASVFVASGPSLYHAVLPTSTPDTQFLQGKEGVAIPAVLETPVSARRVECVQHLAEVQSIALVELQDSVAIGSIDALGRVSVVHYNPEEAFCSSSVGTAAEPSGAHQAVPKDTYQLVPSAPIREPGWAGVALSRQQADAVATSHFFHRSLVQYQNQIPLRTIHLHDCPTSVRFLPPDFPACASGMVMATTYGAQVGIWDMRVADHGALVAELSLTSGSGRLYDVQCSECGRAMIGAAGAERAVGLWEPRKWTSICRWNNCLKYEVHSLHFSTVNPEYCYVAGADYEVLCGTWSKEQRKGGGSRTGKGAGHNPEASSPPPEGEEAMPMAFRGDARWLGLARAQRADLLAGLSSSGHVFVAEMSPRSC